MKCYTVSNPKGPLELTTRPIPTPSEKELLLKIICCGICLGDAHIINGVFPSVKYPRIPGHEIIGKVIKHGSSKKDIPEGTIVGVRMPAGVLFDGGFSEYMTVPENLITIIPNGMDPIEAAPFLCAGVTTYDALKHSNAGKGDLVGVVGIGGLGHLAIQFANKMGFKVVGISKSEDKKEMALKLGCEYFINYNKEDVGKELIKLGSAKVILVRLMKKLLINWLKVWDLKEELLLLREF
jgi:D-arabinose 1-dehydrogenase-like Zn-dependent alcohol dehydrogenase